MWLCVLVAKGVEADLQCFIQLLKGQMLKRTGVNSSRQRRSNVWFSNDSQSSQLPLILASVPGSTFMLSGHTMPHVLRLV